MAANSAPSIPQPTIGSVIRDLTLYRKMLLDVLHALNKAGWRATEKNDLAAVIGGLTTTTKDLRAIVSEEID